MALESRSAATLPARARERFANDIGLRDLAPLRFRLNVGDQWRGQPNGESLHGPSASHAWPAGKTEPFRVAISRDSLRIQEEGRSYPNLEIDRL
jgi:hypothetical protein